MDCCLESILFLCESQEFLMKRIRFCCKFQCFLQKKYELMEIIESFEICITILLKNSGFVLQNDTLFQEKSDFTLFVKSFDDL